MCSPRQHGYCWQQMSYFDICRTRPRIKLKASMEPPGLVQELKSNELESIVKRESGSDMFDEMKYRFLSFKRQKYM